MRHLLHNICQIRKVVESLMACVGQQSKGTPPPGGGGLEVGGWVEGWVGGSVTALEAPDPPHLWGV